jgi:hypothetical protein
MQAAYYLKGPGGPDFRNLSVLHCKQGASSGNFAIPLYVANDCPESAERCAGLPLSLDFGLGRENFIKRNLYIKQKQYG